MAIVKLKYTKSKGKAKAHLRYITHWPGRDHAPTTRVLFRQDGQTDKEWAYRLIDSAKRGATFFKLVLSPDPKTEDKHKDLDLWRLATTTLRSLAERLGKPLSFVGVTHNDHTPNRHVHVLFALTGRLTRADIALLRTAVTEASRAQAAERHLVFRTHATRAELRPLQAALSRPRVRALRPYRPAQPALFRLCPHCLIVTRMTVTASSFVQCTRCSALSAGTTLSLMREEAGWGL